MGTKTIVGTQLVRMVEDAKLPDSLKTGVIQAVMQDGSIPDYIADNLVQGIGFKADRYYDYADKGYYIHGLPTGKRVSASQGYNQIKTFLEAQEGAPVAIEYARTGTLNFLHYAWTQIADNHGYDSVSNRIHGLPLVQPLGTKAYLQDIEIIVPEEMLPSYKPETIAQWGRPPNAGPTDVRVSGTTAQGSVRKGTPIITSPTRVSPCYVVKVVEFYSEKVQVNNVWKHPWESSEYSYTFPLDVVEADEGSYIQVAYVVGGITKWFTYLMGSGTHPTLDALAFAQQEISGKYFPFGYFRYEKQSEVDNKESESYKSTKKLLKTIGLDYDQIGEAIDENPDIADVIQAYMMLGVPAESTDPMELRYLYEFFDGLYQSQGADVKVPGITEQWIWSTAGKPAVVTEGRNAFSIDIADKRFRMRLLGSAILKQYGSGVIGPLGSYKGFLSTERYETTTLDSEGYLAPYVDIVKVHNYQFQITASSYITLRVTDLEMLYYVYGRHLTTSDTTKNILLIPLDKTITDKYSIPQREKLYARSLHFVFNSMQVIKTKWYQSGFFSFLLVAIAIVISAVMAFSDGGSLAGLATATTAAAIQTVIIEVLYSLVVSQLISYGIQLVAKLVGGDLAIFLAVVAALYVGYRAFQAGGIKGIPFAKDILGISSNLAQAGMQQKMGDLMEDFANFDKWKDEQLDALGTANKLLEQNHSLSPITIFGEQPTDFYNRTVHSGNIGAIALSYTSNYVAEALRLPELKDTALTWGDVEGFA